MCGRRRDKGFLDAGRTSFCNQARGSTRTRKKRATPGKITSIASRSGIPPHQMEAADRVNGINPSEPWLPSGTQENDRPGPPAQLMPLQTKQRKG